MDSTAGRLHDRLMEERRILLVLDDVWKPIDLDSLGIPNAESHPECKVVITSRSRKVCRQMDMKEMKIEVLNDEESWKLFTQQAGIAAEHEEIEPTARKITKECGGLPLAINIIGKALRREEISTWTDALDALQRSVPHIDTIEEEVFEPLEWSFNSLKVQGVNAKSCLLYCALYPEDHSIEITELVWCWIGEGLLDDELEDSTDCFARGTALVKHLQESCLLEEGLFMGTVKMHDVVRDVAIRMARSTEDGSKSLVRSGIHRNQIAGSASWDTFRRISFSNTQITELPHCREVVSLLLIWNKKLEEIPAQFLLGFPRLKVLNLCETGIKYLPPFIEQLIELRTLLLRDCKNLELLPERIGKLQNLQFLDCSGTGLRELPEGMKNLKKLEMLDLLDTKSLIKIPVGVMSELSHLEILDMRGSLYMLTSSNISFSEFRNLEQLRFLYLHFDTEYFVHLRIDDLFWILKLEKFHFLTGTTFSPRNYRNKIYLTRGLTFAKKTQLDRSLTLEKVNFSCDSIKWFLNNVNILHLIACDELPSEYSYRDLKSLIVYPKLDIGERPLLNFSLPNVRSIFLSDGSKVKYLFSSEVPMSSFKDLEEIRISNCPSFLGFFDDSSSTKSAESSKKRPSPSHFPPKLKELTLFSLPMLTTLCDQGLSFEHLEVLEVYKCDQLKKLPFNSGEDFSAIKEIRGSQEWWDNLEWEDENTKSRLQQYFKL